MTVAVSDVSRPLRALWLLIVGYAALRAALLMLAATPLPEIVPERFVLTPHRSMPSGRFATAPVVREVKPRQTVAEIVSPSRPSAMTLVVHSPTSVAAGPETAHVIDDRASTPPDTIFSDDPGELIAIATPSGPARPARASPRFTASAWSIGRADGPRAIAPGGSLGGSQAGVRLWYRATPLISLTGKLSTGLATADRDASIGAAVRRGPAGIIVERRFAIGDGRDRTVVTAFAGIDGLKLPFDTRMAGFLQAGFADTDGFVDGALHVERALIRRAGVQLAGGLGAWGGVQPGARRLDVGPELTARVPVADRNVRVSLEWRQRVAGNAKPGSGPAATVAFDY